MQSNPYFHREVSVEEFLGLLSLDDVFFIRSKDGWSQVVSATRSGERSKGVCSSLFYRIVRVERELRIAPHRASKIATRQYFPLMTRFGGGARSKPCFSQAFIETRFSNMGCSYYIEPGAEIHRFAIASRQVAKVHEQSNHAIIAIRLFRGDQGINLIPTFQFFSGYLIEMIRSGDFCLSRTSRLLFGGFFGGDLASFSGEILGARRSSPKVLLFTPSASSPTFFYRPP